VLSAITVALGGKSSSTGRGSGLKSLIREGQKYLLLLTKCVMNNSYLCCSIAEVSIKLKNTGDEAYKHDIYGDSIIITRRFSKDGSSSYKIKSKDGKVISTKREELSAICDHMNIQVDNPMNVLTQGGVIRWFFFGH
jgi:structural maintenance of chromosomes protein 6